MTERLAIHSQALSLLLANWTGSTPVPEPATAGLLVLGGILLVLRRWLPSHRPLWSCFTHVWSRDLQVLSSVSGSVERASGRWRAMIPPEVLFFVDTGPRDG